MVWSKHYLRSGWSDQSWLRSRTSTCYGLLSFGHASQAMAMTKWYVGLDINLPQPDVGSIYSLIYDKNKLVMSTDSLRKPTRFELPCRKREGSSTCTSNKKRFPSSPQKETKLHNRCKLPNINEFLRYFFMYCRQHFECTLKISKLWANYCLRTALVGDHNTLK